MKLFLVLTSIIVLQQSALAQSSRRVINLAAGQSIQATELSLSDVVVCQGGGHVPPPHQPPQPPPPPACTISNTVSAFSSARENLDLISRGVCPNFYIERCKAYKGGIEDHAVAKVRRAMLDQLTSIRRNIENACSSMACSHSEIRRALFDFDELINKALRTMMVYKEDTTTKVHQERLFDSDIGLRPYCR